MARKASPKRKPIHEDAPPADPVEVKPPLINISDCTVTVRDTAGEAAANLARALMSMADAAAKLADRLNLPTNVIGINLSHVGDAVVANSTISRHDEED